jgi:hypothetical protein
MFKLTLLIFLSSCSFFVDKIDRSLVQTKEYKNVPEPPVYCPIDQKLNFQLVGTKDNSQEVYLNLVKSLNQKLDFLDHFALWSLMQLKVRPDQSSATSRLQVLIHYQEKSYYFDFFSESSDNQFPYLYGVEWILKKFNKKTSLETYAEMLRHPVLKNLKIGKDFETFLVKNLSAIKNDPQLVPYYFRGAEVLKENETSPALDFLSVIKLFRKNQKEQKILVNTTLNEFFTESGSSGKCNYDFNLYDHSIFLIDKVIPVANIFGLSSSQSVFFSSSSQRLDNIESLMGFSLFKGVSKVRSSAVCMMENQTKRIWTFSNQSRDPGQHLFHLVRYGLPSSKSTQEVSRLIKHSRHLFLSDPVRLVIESARSSKDQIENLLKLNLPIYHAESLGNIWAHTHFSEGDRFIIDGRNPGSFLCK